MTELAVTTLDRTSALALLIRDSISTATDHLSPPVAPQLRIETFDGSAATADASPLLFTWICWVPPTLTEVLEAA